MNNTMNLTNQQKSVVSWIENVRSQEKDLFVSARAGAGKTSTIVSAVKNLVEKDANIKILVCAFNKEIQKELQGMLPENINVATLHSLGLKAIKKNIKNIKVNNNKSKQMIKKSGLVSPDIDTLFSKMKNTLHTDRIGVQKIIDNFGLDIERGEIGKILALFQQSSKSVEIDFDDMIFLPVYKKMECDKYNIIIVDEAQDLNPAQMSLIERHVDESGRLVLVGDMRQAIYGWRGADVSLLKNFSENNNVLALSTTFRCGRSIVKNVHKELPGLVPDFESGTEFAGTVDVMRLDVFHKNVEPGDFIISRTNAPLVKMAMNLLASGVRCKIRGRDIVQNIMSFVEKTKSASIVEMLESVETFEQKEKRKLLKQDASETAFQALSDKCECIRALAGMFATITEMKKWLEEIQSESENSDSVVVLMTAHRSKGLETSRVFLLRNTFKQKKKKEEEESDGSEEDNCLYVALTRAKQELYYITE